jgi:molecular chaperone DnaJ
LQCIRCAGKRNEPGTSFKKCETCAGSGEVQSQQRIFIGSFTQISTCPACKGEGKIPEKKCEKCRGAGRVLDIETIPVKIPAGIRSGEVFKMPDKGEAGDGGSGNLYIRVHVKEHPKFTREGDDIISSAEISISQAALGESLRVPTLEGDVDVQIPGGVESGEMIKLQGKGMPGRGRAGRGDQYVRIIVKTPKRLTRRGRELFEELRKEGM